MPDGRMLFDVHMTRAGVFEYVQKDGSIRRELRPRKEVFDKESMDSYSLMPATQHHPERMVAGERTDNTVAARDVMVGATGDTVARDDDHIRGQVMIHDKPTIALMRRYPEVSCGYKCDVLEQAGVDPEYGPYDAIQTNIRGNHLAVAVPVARAGQTARVRFDSEQRWVKREESERFDAADLMYAASDSFMAAAETVGQTVLLTDIVDGHQHTINTTCFSNGIGDTSWSLSEGADGSHSHAVIHNTDGTYAVAFNAGHSHSVVVADATAVYDSDVRNDNNKEESMKTDTDKTAAMAQQLAAAEARAAAAEQKLATETARADAAEGRVDGLEKDIKGLRSERTDAAVIAEKDAEIAKLQKRCDSAERALTSVPERIKQGVVARVHLERAAAPIMVSKEGGEYKMDSLTDREIMVAVVERVHGVSIEKERSDDYARARFDSAVESWKAGASVLARITEQVETSQAKQAAAHRTDAAQAPTEAWKRPLPSSKFKEG